MNISQAAKLTRLSAKQIRDYEKAGLLPPAIRTESGYRIYSEKDLIQLQFIYNARQVGFSLAQIAQLIDLQNNPNRNSRDVKKLTAIHIQELETQIAHLQTMLKLLRNWHQCCHGDDSPECPILEGLKE